MKKLGLLLIILFCGVYGFTQPQERIVQTSSYHQEGVQLHSVLKHDVDGKIITITLSTVVVDRYRKHKKNYELEKMLNEYFYAEAVLILNEVTKEYGPKEYLFSEAKEKYVNELVQKRKSELIETKRVQFTEKGIFERVLQKI